MELQVFEHRAELLNPQAHTILSTFCHHTNLVVAHHTFTADMHLLPAAQV